jgi:intracellular septation protein
MSIPHLFTPSVFKKVLAGSALEFGPIVIFLLSFHYLHIYKATMILMLMTIISTIATYKVQKRLPYLALYVALITIGFGYLTLSLHQPRFIQMRDTLYDVTCAVTLIIGLIFDISFLKYAFDSVFPTTTKAWDKITYAWIVFFIANAGLNEYIRRTMSLKFWFDFKSTMVLITIVFGIITLILFYEKKAEHAGN